MGDLGSLSLECAVAAAVAVFFYLVAGWRTWQVIMLKSSPDDETALLYASGKFPVVLLIFFVVFWLAILTVTNGIALWEKHFGVPRSRVRLRRQPGE